MKSGRPKLPFPPQTPLERLANIVGYASFLTMVLFMVFNWRSMPDSVPTHFNIAGEADDWGSKWSLIILPMIAIFLHIMMEFVEKNPHTHNFPVALTEENAPKLYFLSRRATNLTKNICTLLLASISISSVKTALGNIEGLNSWWMGLLLMALFGVMIMSFLSMRKYK